MGLWNTIQIALVALRLNKMRSFLTMLGILIGISSVIVMAAVGICTLPAVAQSPDTLSISSFWLAGGNAYTTTDNFSTWWSGHIRLGGRYKSTTITSRLSLIGEQNFFTGDRVWEVGALVGYGLPKAHSLISVGAGLAVAWGSRGPDNLCFSCDPPKKRADFGPEPGLALEAQIMASIQQIGIGLYAFANINSEEPFKGIALSLYLGDLR